MTTPWTDADRVEFARRGIPLEEADRQIRVLTTPARYARLDRPCTVGDGIERIDAARGETLIARARAAAESGRVTKLVPASGAASRMFKELLAALAGGAPLTREEIVSRTDATARAVRTFAENIRRFAFADDLASALRARGAGDLDALCANGPYAPVLAALLDADAGGLGYAERPKGLIPFHRYAGEGARTPFEEHLVEAAALIADRAHVARVRFTVPESAREAFRELAARRVPQHERRTGARFDVSYSAQKPSTDTIAVDTAGLPFRDARGALVFRPAGHGALLENLHDLGAGGADIVFLKNIDNVVPDHLRAATERWTRIVIGRLVEEQEKAGADRPVRVCGMVPNTGEPGGGPFWVRDAGAQIVESAEVDPSDATQQALFACGTHFNPVFLACGLRAPGGGAPHDLHAFVDRDAVIVTRKSHGGRELHALERPGLWNGSMARWRTVFVEVPGDVFTPVKTVLDLLRPEHQPA